MYETLGFVRLGFVMEMEICLRDWDFVLEIVICLRDRD